MNHPQKRGEGEDVLQVVGSTSSLYCDLSTRDRRAGVCWSPLVCQKGLDLFLARAVGCAVASGQLEFSVQWPVLGSRRGMPDFQRRV